MVTNMKTATPNFKVTVQNQELAPVGFKAWLGVFPAVSALAIATQMSGALAFCAAASLSVTMAVVAHASIKDADNDGKFEAKQRAIGLMAPALFALLMWLSVLAGGALASTFVTSSAVAFGVFGGLVALDLIAAAATLFILERGEGVCGLSLASLINGKYSGLLGRLV
jgi:hypothetical protein